VLQDDLSQLSSFFKEMKRRARPHCNALFRGHEHVKTH
jgi:hypothetical protein